MSPLFTVAITIITLTPGTIYGYMHYRKNRQHKAEFILFNCMVVLILFTMYLASAMLK